MSSAWLLPEYIADVLPSEARRIEELRRQWMDLARTYGFELVIPPLSEHLDALLSGTGSELDLRTFKLVDQLSGRTLGIRADTTVQAARIDAHLLNRQGVTRLCYCGPVLHTRPAALNSSREPLQFGAEIFGHAGLEADLEAQELVLDGLSAALTSQMTIDLGDARLVRSVLAGSAVDASVLTSLVAALTAKDRSLVKDLSVDCPAATRDALLNLLDLFGDASILDDAKRLLPDRAPIQDALRDMAWLAGHLQTAYPDVQVSVDLSDMSGYAYYSGVRFAVYAQGVTSALARGGRYDEVGAAFGRNRPAVGFSLDLKSLSLAVGGSQIRPAILAPWGENPELRAAIRQLRSHGETVVCVLPGHENEVQEFECDRELVEVQGLWVLQSR